MGAPMEIRRTASNALRSATFSDYPDHQHYDGCDPEQVKQSTGDGQGEFQNQPEHQEDNGEAGNSVHIHRSSAANSLAAVSAAVDAVEIPRVQRSRRIERVRNEQPRWENITAFNGTAVSFSVRNAERAETARRETTE
jgi:hypothetical protein